MPYAFIIVGLAMLVSGARGTSSDLLTLIKSDLTGTNNFFYWIVAILAIGAVGYIDTLKGVSRAFLVLVLVVLVLADNKQNGGGGLFVKFDAALKEISQ